MVSLRTGFSSRKRAAREYLTSLEMSLADTGRSVLFLFLEATQHFWRKGKAMKLAHLITGTLAGLVAWTVTGSAAWANNPQDLSALLERWDKAAKTEVIRDVMDEPRVANYDKFPLGNLLQ